MQSVSYVFLCVCAYVHVALLNQYAKHMRCII